MSLKISTSPKQIIKWVVAALLGIFVLVFFIRVATFEADYYSRMEGSERDSNIANVPTETEELIEEKPTEDVVRQYNVEPDRPRYLSIPKLDIYNARVLAMGVDANGALSTPRNIHDVGWYVDSGKPGLGKTMVIDGHNGGPRVHGVFKDLPRLVPGDQIVIERGDGEIFTYVVRKNAEVPLSEANSYMATAMRSFEKGVEGVTLITCSGEWSQTQGTFLSRQFVHATLIK